LRLPEALQSRGRRGGVTELADSSAISAAINHEVSHSVAKQCQFKGDKIATSRQGKQSGLIGRVAEEFPEHKKTRCGRYFGAQRVCVA